MQNIIEVHNLTKYYPSIKNFKDFLLSPFKRRQVLALDCLNLSIGRGSILGLLGPNGAGKTTLLKILSTLVHPTSGRAIVNGFDVVQQGRQVRRSIGIVMTEERSFYWRLTGRQNLLFFASLNNLSSHQRNKRVSEVLHQTELDKDGNRMFKDYSTGMKQRLSIARGLLCDPDIILLDEPTRSLDPHAAKNMRSFLKEKIVGNTKRSAVLATHNLQEVEEICSHVAIIKGGSLMTHGTIDDLKTQTAGKYYLLRLSLNKTSIDLSSLPAVQSVTPLSDAPNLFQVKSDDISTVLKKIIDMGGSIEECVQKQINLEDIFSKAIEG